MLDTIIAWIDYYILGKAFKCACCKNITYGGFGDDKLGKGKILCSENCIKKHKENNSGGK